MILTALKELAEAEGLLADPDYEPKSVSRVVELASDGRLLGVMDIRVPDAKGKARPATLSVPKTFKRAGIAPPPYFLYENAKFAFGVDTNSSGVFIRSDDRLTAFRSLVDRAANETQDPGLKAMAGFLKQQQARTDREVVLPDDFEPTDWFVFRMHGDDGFVHNRPAVKAWWERQRVQTEEPDAFCLVTGLACAAAETHDPVKNIPNAPGQGVALVVCKSPTDAFDSYGLQGGKKAPVSREAAEAYTRALNRLLSPGYPDPKHSGQTLPPRSVRISADTAVLFWTANPAHPFGDDFLSSLSDPGPEVVGRMLAAPRTGERLHRDDEVTRFHALTLSGGQGRATVRDWFTTSVGEMAQRVGKWFADLELSFPFESAPHPAIGALLRSVVLEGKQDNIAPNLAAQVFQAIIRDTPLPLTLLHAALRRCKAEGVVGKDRRTGKPDWRRSHLRMQVVKAVLQRWNRAPTRFPEIRPMLDETNAQPAYLLGRLFAVLEGLQAAAQPGINATIGDRYYGAASTAPVTAFPRLIGLSRHHLGKLRRDKPGVAINLDRSMTAVLGHFPAQRFPSVFSMEEQGLFAIGYYHQRQALFTKHTKEEGADDANS